MNTDPTASGAYAWPANLSQLLGARPELHGVGVSEVSALEVMSA